MWGLAGAHPILRGQFGKVGAMCEDGKLDVISYPVESAAGHVNWPLRGEYPQWFALAVKPRFDKSVAQALEMKGYETLLPLYKKHHKYGTRSKFSELPLFPGYVCCRFDVQSRLPILTTPGVIQVLGAGNMPVPLADVEVSSLKTALNAQHPVVPYPFVDEGQRVRINSGALAGVEGIVISFTQRVRLVLSITMLQRSVLLEIDRELVSVEDAADWAEPGRSMASGLTTLDLAEGD
jgi:transcription antitermination factor NusG